MHKFINQSQVKVFFMLKFRISDFRSFWKCRLGQRGSCRHSDSTVASNRRHAQSESSRPTSRCHPWLCYASARNFHWKNQREVVSGFDGEIRHWFVMINVRNYAILKLRSSIRIRTKFPRFLFFIFILSKILLMWWGWEKLADSKLISLFKQCWLMVR